jgi:hypothetical protein
MSMRTRNKVRDTNLIKEGIELFIFTTPVCLHCDDLSIKKSLNKGLKFMELLKHLRFKLNKIDPREYTKVIDKTHIILISSSPFRSWTPNI